MPEPKRPWRLERPTFFHFLVEESVHPFCNDDNVNVRRGVVCNLCWRANPSLCWILRKPSHLNTVYNVQYECASMKLLTQCTPLRACVCASKNGTYTGPSADKVEIRPPTVLLKLWHLCFIQRDCCQNKIKLLYIYIFIYRNTHILRECGAPGSSAMGTKLLHGLIWASFVS